MSPITRSLALAIGVALLLAAAGRAGAEELWTDNFEQAKAQAKKEGKDLLLDFTGSDWCGWCIKLHAEVFDTEKFKAEAPKKFVLVTLDFPNRKKLTDATKKQNAELAAQFGIQGYPTIVLLDSDGRAYGKTGYQAGGEEKYLEHLAEFQKVKAERDTLLAEADKATGVERAKALEKVIEALSKNHLGPMDNRAWVDEIIKLDDKNEAGLKGKYEKMIRLADAEKLAQARKFDDAVAAIDKTIADLKLTGQDAQNALFLKGHILSRKGDPDAAEAAMKAALDAAPDGEKAQQIQGILKQMNDAKNTDQGGMF